MLCPNLANHRWSHPTDEVITSNGTEKDEKREDSDPIIMELITQENWIPDHLLYLCSLYQSEPKQL